MRKKLVALATAIVAVSAAIVSFGSPPQAHAGSPLALSIDCDLSTGGIQSSCTYASGTTTVTVGVIFTTSASFTLSGFNATILAPNAGFAPPATGSGLDANPDFTADTTDLADWSCGPPNPDNDIDSDGDPSTAQSFISCFNGFGTGPATGSTLELARVTYTVSSDGVRALSFFEAQVNDDSFSQVIACPSADPCNGATVQIGASAATATATNTATPTNTAVPTATACSGASCPTPTSLAYKTVTPTGTIVVGTATPLPGEATTAPPPPPPPPPPGGGSGGTTGGGGTGGIRLPDTGTGAASNQQDTRTIAIAALFGAVLLAGSLSFSAAATRRRWED